MAFPEIDSSIKAFDKRRDIAVFKTADDAIVFTAKYIVNVGQAAQSAHSRFSIALSGGNTPKAVFMKLAEPSLQDQLVWDKALVFFSDERSVPPDHKDSNFKSAMDSGLGKLPIPRDQIFRMEAEELPDIKAEAYERLIEDKLSGNALDLTMLGMGPDGHTASLFPKTHALHSQDRKVVANYVPKLDTWRMTFTFPMINASRHIIVLAFGKDKAHMVKEVLTGAQDPDALPAIRVGTETHKALWILDEAAAEELTAK
ncbi:6-phosphogluconolactonase [Estrella lausannensis]|uniref:6-phosphogluconolactonase n=1 Tax=Estrella lausannensis TaxID=483423 RepID=A0A0H5E4H8_9BACT|nr:6-phosphogluconolactonase [Estrella lausannensis]CRX38115.1 6-phosphogluconolactonase [Estrella lausannensis]